MTEKVQVVVGVFIHNKEEVLLIRRSGSDFFTFPESIVKGKEEEDKPARALERELGIKLDGPEIIGGMIWQGSSNDAKSILWFIIECKGELVPTENVSEFGFFGKDDFPKEKTDKETKRIFRLLIDERKI